MNGNWEPMEQDPDLDLRSRPNCIRPETHWWQDALGQGRSDGRLWMSLQLSLDGARQLRDAYASPDRSGYFGEIANGMAPASYAALRFAIAVAERERQDASGRWSKAADPLERTLGTDILVGAQAHEALRRLAADGTLEITDAGLALDGGLADLAPPDAEANPKPDVVPKSVVPKALANPSPVIIAIIDDGIGIANHRFRQTATTTRVKHFLDLSTAGARRAHAALDEVLGWSWTEADINDLLAANPDDEERVYRALGLIDTATDRREPLRAAVSHGTHTLDTAAGYDWRTGQGQLDGCGRPIIAVQVPTQAGEDRSDAWMPLSLKRGLDWILVKADELSVDINEGNRLPLIVNCSFGSMAGPMDGWSDVERRITQFVRTYRADGPAELCTLVMSAGNSFNFRSAGRVKVQNGPVSLPWRILPDDKTPSFVQLWLPETEVEVDPKTKAEIEAQQVRVALRPPGETEARAFSKLNRAIDWTVGGAVCARLYHQSWTRPEGKRRQSITIAVRASDDDGAPVPQPVVPAGLWHIDIEPVGQLNNPLEVDLHVHRDDVAMFARRKGRQSYFDDPAYQAPDMPGGLRPADAPEARPDTHPFVRAQGTLNAYGFGEGTVLVAGYRASDAEPASYSSAGADDMKRRAKDRHGNPLIGPDLAAVTEESPMLPGILRTGTYSGSMARLNGTSVAAPLAARALADAIATGGSVEALKDRAAQTLMEKRPKPVHPPQGIGKSPEPVSDEDGLRFGAGLLPFTPARPAADRHSG
jgi:hypothetical protein